MAAKPKERRPRQQRIPGTEEPHHADLDGMAGAYFEAVQERLPYTKAEGDAKEALILGMVKHGLTRYITAEGFIVDLVDSKNVKVKKKKGESNGEG